MCTESSLLESVLSPNMELSGTNLDLVEPKYGYQTPGENSKRNYSKKSNKFRLMWFLFKRQQSTNWNYSQVLSRKNTIVFQFDNILDDHVYFIETWGIVC